MRNEWWCHWHPRTGKRALLLITLLTVPACSLLGRPTSPAPLATSLQEVAPHRDRDHFVYVWLRTIGAEVVADGIQVEHLTAIGDTGEFEVTLSENGMGLGVTRIRDTGHALLLLSEGLGPGLRVTYDPPLPQLEVPLFPGERRMSSTGTVQWLADEQRVESLPVTQIVEARAAPPVHTRLGDYDRGVLLRTIRTWQFSEGPLQLTTVALLVPGIGEVRSEGKASGAPALYRELACATLAERRIGDCRKLKSALEALKHAGPTHLP